MIDWFPIRLSFAVASAATLIALIAGSALAWLLARNVFRGALLDALITLPLVLPPTVLGYYLLVLLGTRSSLGGLSLQPIWNSVDVYCHGRNHRGYPPPRPPARDEESLRAAFEGDNLELESAARTLGLSNHLVLPTPHFAARVAKVF